MRSFSLQGPREIDPAMRATSPADSANSSLPLNASGQISASEFSIRFGGMTKSCKENVATSGLSASI